MTNRLDVAQAELAVAVAAEDLDDVQRALADALGDGAGEMDIAALKLRCEEAWNQLAAAGLHLKVLRSELGVAERWAPLPAPSWWRRALGAVRRWFGASHG